jgi:glycosyltransferase involved in cell wall biosynthesis
MAILTDLSVDHRCHKWARSLRDAGYNPVILCDQPLHPLGAAWEGFDVRIITRESHQRRFFPVFAAYLWNLTRTLLTTKAQVWISLDAPPLFWLALVGKLRGRTVVYDSHELYLQTPLVLNRLSRRIFWTLWERCGFALIRRAVTVSPAILDRLHAAHAHVRFHLLPNMPIRPPVFPEAAALEPGQPVRLVFQGGLRVATGLPELFAALATRSSLHNATLDIYGGGPEEASLRAAAQAAGLMQPHPTPRVRFHGSIPFEEIPAKMAEAHIGIHLMQPVCGSFALTWANKTFDYAQAGLPVLLSENPAHHALLAEHPVGEVADSYSPEDIGDALDRLVAQHATFAAAARVARERWHWDTYFRGLPRFLGL